MARQINRLSPRGVVTITKPGLHADGGGLYLQISPLGAKSWAFIFQWRGARKQMGLGGLLTTTLAEARAAAEEARKMVVRGVNPIEAKKVARSGALTFGVVADDLIAALSPEWKNDKHAYQWKQSLTVDAAALRPLAVDAVTTEDVLEVLKPIWSVKPETASRTRGRIERVLDAAKAKGLRQGENPARWKGHLDHLLPKRKKLTRGHLAAMPFDQVSDFVGQLRARPALAARALELTILTVGRTNEVLGARRPEFDMVKRIWTVPAERMKMGVEHRVPLSDRAVVILEALFAEIPEGTDLLFADAAGEKPLSNMAMSMLLRRMGVSEYTVHGFRSSFRDWAGESTTFPEAVAEAALAHQIGNEVERAYRRGDALEKRRKLMQAWAGFVGRPRSSTVVEMRRA